MKTIMFTAVFQSASGHVSEHLIEVRARDINSGFRKATERALRKEPGGRWEIHSLTFSEVR